MSWGVATQNGVSVSLASIVSLSCGATEFSPASLFTSGVAGAWYDPSDYSTLFQDSFGLTPVTAVEQAVRLMLDKSQGLVLGSELVTNGDFATGTTAGFTATSGNVGTSSVISGELNVVAGGGGSGGFYQDFTVVQGATYLVSVTARRIAGAGSVRFQAYDGGSFTTLIRQFFDITTTGAATTYSAYIRTTSTTTMRVYLYADTSTTGGFDNVTAKLVSGNHALAPNDPSRPILRARYNLLTYSEQFDNAAWTKSFVTLSANAAVAPDGTTTADLIYPITGTYRGVYQRPTLASGIFVTTIYAKAAGKSWVAFVDFGGGINRAWANVSTGELGTVSAGYSLTITAAQNGWYRLDFTQTAAAANPYLWISVCDADNTNTGTTNGTDGIYIWGADLRTGSSAGTYQRIAAATDYATAGFLPYLYFVTDDSFGTNSIDFTATDKMSVCAGVTKSSDATTAVLAELSASSGVNTGVFAMFAPGSPASKRFGFNSNGNAGTVAEAATTDTAYNAPFTVVLTGQGDISGDSLTLRANATQVGSSTADQGTGNYGNYPLYIGRRNNASLPFTGNIYQLVVVGKTLSASELASTEAYVNSKTGAY